MPRNKINRVKTEMTKEVEDEIFILITHTYSIKRISELRNNDPIISEMNKRYPNLFYSDNSNQYRYNSAQYLYDRMYSDKYSKRYKEAKERGLETMMDRTTDINYLKNIAHIDGQINTAGVALAKLNCDQINRSFALFVAMNKKQENTNCTVEFKL